MSDTARDTEWILRREFSTGHVFCRGHLETLIQQEWNPDSRKHCRFTLRAVGSDSKKESLGSDWVIEMSTDEESKAATQQILDEVFGAITAVIAELKAVYRIMRLQKYMAAAHKEAFG